MLICRITFQFPFLTSYESECAINVPDFQLMSLRWKQVIMQSWYLTKTGSHTIGRARCLSFRQRIYEAKLEYHYGYDRYKRYTNFRRILRSICPVTGRDNKFAPLDYETPKRFDNHYFINILQGNGLLGSDNVLIKQDYDGKITKLVWAYASNEGLFFDSFAKSMIKMGIINVLTGNEGEIRKNCRFVNA